MLRGRGLRALGLLLLPACIEYNPAGKPDDSMPVGTDEAPDDTAPDTDTATDTDTDSAPPDEACDGVDNDGDGLVDEGFDDIDGDAVADCVDTTCTIPLDGDEGVSDTHTCTNVVAPAMAPWEVELWWSSEDSNYCAHPVAFDLDRDGLTEILCADFQSEEVTVFDGTSGLVRARWADFIDDTHLAVADLDRDGSPEVVGFSGPRSEQTPRAVEADGTTLWRSTEVLSGSGGSSPLEVRDIDGDGNPEVVSYLGSVRGADGVSAAAWVGREVDQDPLFQLAVDDLDRDGVLELAYNWEFWDTSDRSWWDLEESYPERFAIPMPVQADPDERAELAWATRDYFVVADLDGAILTSRTFSESDQTFYAEPCAGDIDGDGAMEVVSPGFNAFKAWELNGVDLWTTPMRDLANGAASCTTFDFDLDGAKEVVVLDQDAMYILDGATGSVLVYADEGFVSATGWDNLLVVVLDGDGSVEILVSTPAMTGLPTLFAWRNVNRDWPPGTQMWPSATWSGTSLLPDGRVPRTPAAPWLTTKVWRGQPETPVFGSDLRPAVGDTCVASCADDGEVRVEVRLQNLGPDEIEAGAPLAVYGLDTAGARVLLDVLRLPDWLDDGRAAASWEVVTTTEQARRGLVFVAGEDGTGAFVPDDCETTNNTLSWALTECG